MKQCPDCGAKCRPTQRTCRSCGHTLEVGEGLFRRLLRFFSDGGTPRQQRRATTRVQLGKKPAGVSMTRQVYHDTESLPPQVREAIERLRPEDNDARDTVISATRTESVGPVTVTENGQTRTYDFLADMPPDVLARFEELTSEARHGAPASGVTVTINGETRTYRSMDEVPPDVRRMMEMARNKAQ